MNFTLFWSIFILFGASYFAVAMLASRRITTDDDYFLAGRQLGIFSITFTLIASQLGAGMMLGTTEEAFHYGIYGLLYNLGICLGFLLLGLGFAAKLRQFNISTTAELFQIKYDSILLRRLASVLSVITLGGILAGQILASRKLISTFTTEHNWILICFWLAVIFYTMFGGLKAAVATDIFQFFLVIAVFGVTAVFIWSGHKSYPVTSLQEIATLQEQYFDSENISWSKMTGLLLMPICFSLIEQDLAQRFFSAKTKKIAIISALLAGIFILCFSCVPLFFGMQARILNLILGYEASVLLSSVQFLANDVLLCFVICALIAAIGSTADSLLCAIGSNIVYDFNVNTARKSVYPYGIFISRGVTFVAGVCALCGAYFFDSILSIITQSYEISVSCLFVPLVFCYLKKKVYKEAAVAALFCGLFGFIVFRLFPISMPREIATLILSLMGYIAGHIWSKMLAKQKN
jgi:solute:Na+ symporter, SSS family